MALTAGSEPTSHSSTLAGLAQELYSLKISKGIIPGESAIVTTVDGTDYTEPTDQRNDRVFKAKKLAWVEASALISHIQNNAEVNNVSSIIDTSLASAIPIPNDGGAGLKTTFSASLQANNPTQKGSIS
jgi:hypothetical protein